MTAECDCWLTLASLEHDHYPNCPALRSEQQDCRDCEPGFPCLDHRGAA